MTCTHSKKVIAVLQPCIPDYRVSFFVKLIHALRQDYEVTLHFSERDENGARTSPRLASELAGLTELNRIEHRSIAGARFHIQSVDFRRLIDADILIINWNIRYLKSVALVIIRALLKRQTIGWGHFNSKNRNTLFSKCRKAMLRLFRAFWLYTDCEVAQAVSELGHLPKTRLVALNNGIDTSEIDFNQVSRACESRSAYQRTRFLFLGRVTKKSNLPLLLQAVSRLNSSGNAAELHVIGEIETPLLASEIQKNHSIVLHGPMFDFESIFDVAVSCKFLVYPGAVGLSLLHGFSLGLPAIIHDTPEGHMPEFCAARFGHNSIPFKEGSVESLAKALIAALEMDTSTYRAMALAALDTVKDKYNVDNMVANALSTLDIPPRNN